jgi:3-phosphoshikimate 1-carboxyvinyltransferase
VALADPTALPDPLEIVPFDGPIDAVAAPPGSKSITNRALLCAALAEGTTALTGVLWSDDTEAMLEGLRALGVVIEAAAADRLIVHGVAGRLRAGPAEVHSRLSGTTSRFLAAAVALGSGHYRLDAAPPMRMRPMGASFDALRQLGVTVTETGTPGCLPATVDVAPDPSGDAPAIVRLAGDVTSQALSGVLMIGPCLPSGLRIELTTELVSRPYVELTMAVMRSFGAAVDADGPAAFVVAAGGYRSPGAYAIEPDATAASYLFGAAAVAGGRIVVPGLGTASAQGDVHFVDVLEQMGAVVERGPHELAVRVEGPLRGIDVDLEPMSDTAQTLAAVAVFASGPTRVRGIGFIRRKETDRIGAVVAELRRLGIDATEADDGFVIHPGAPKAGVVRTYDDHRMAMSFALLGLRSAGVQIADPGCVAKTFPTYFAVLESLRPRRGQEGRPLQ